MVFFCLFFPSFLLSTIFSVFQSFLLLRLPSHYLSIFILSFQSVIHSFFFTRFTFFLLPTSRSYVVFSSLLSLFLPLFSSLTYLTLMFYFALSFLQPVIPIFFFASLSSPTLLYSLNLFTLLSFFHHYTHPFLLPCNDSLRDRLSSDTTKTFANFR